MATETLDDRASHVRGVTVTAVAALAGIAAALASSAATTATQLSATDTRVLGLVGAFVLVQLPLLRLLGVDVDDFSTKDYLYVAFMTFSMWFVTWGIMLTSDTAVTLP